MIFSQASWIDLILLVKKINLSTINNQQSTINNQMKITLIVASIIK